MSDCDFNSDEELEYKSPNEVVETSLDGLSVSFDTETGLMTVSCKVLFKFHEDFTFEKGDTFTVIMGDTTVKTPKLEEDQ